MDKNIMIELNNAITREHGGKMAGYWSLSTSCLLNEHCMKRHAAGNTVCARCYAWRQLSYQTSTREKMARNTELLTKTEILPEQVPFLNVTRFRFEAFGELANTLQVKNYFTIAEQNPHCTFALWTKNAWIIKNAMEQYKISKPANMIIIASLPTVDKFDSCETAAIYDSLRNNGYSFIDKLFCVYTKAYAAEHGITINCGARDCMTCGRCYTLGDTTKVINEILK